jgi:GNAT superfamily N-acetyltransferase
MSELQQLENHWLACMASLGGGGTMTRVVGGLVVTNPQVAGSFANFLTLRGVAPERLDLTLEMAGAVLAGAGRPPALFLSPLAGAPGPLGDALRARGWRPQVRQVVLARDLPAPPAAVAPAVSVTEVVGAVALNLWGRTLVDAYEVNPVAGAAINQAWTALAAAPGDGARARFLVARLDGEPAGTGLSWTQGGITGLYCGAVLPAFRRRGVERATLVRRLELAALDRSSLALLQTEVASPVAHLCTAHLGFRAVYERELWLGPPVSCG